MNPRLLSDYVLLEVVPNKLADSYSMIAIPQSAHEPSKEAIVRRVGPKCRDVAVGDRVLFDNVEGEEFAIGSREFRVVKPKQLIAVLTSIQQ